MSRKQTLCWTCQRATGGHGCSWADRLLPVDGWQAEQRDTESISRHGASYIVCSCPLYQEDDPREIIPDYYWKVLRCEAE